MASQELLNTLGQQIETIKKSDPSRLVNRPEWGTLNFEDCSIEIHRTFKLSQDMAALPMQMLPDAAINQIIAATNLFNLQLQRIDQFSISASQSPSQERNQIRQNIRSTADQLFTQAAPLVSYLAIQRGDMNANTEKIALATARAEELVTQSKGRIAAKEKEMDMMLSKARETSASSGTAIFTTEFQTAADESNIEARHWLFAAGGLAIITVLAAWAMWEWTERGLDNGQLFQKVSTRLVTLAVLLSATIWCGRNYKALKHLATVNRHRALSLRTLQAFSAAAADPQTKDAVLLEATRAVFGNVPTGYIDDNGDSDLKIVEIARSILPKADK